MSSLRKKLGKLKGRSLDELRLRGGQFLAASAERYGLSTGARLSTDAEFFRMLEPLRGADAAITSAETLLAHFRTRTRPHFFAAFDHPEVTRAELKRRFGASGRDALIARADRIADGRFDLLGLRDISFGDPPDWHLNPVSKQRAPLQHWSIIDYLDVQVAGDKKIIWELNRHQYFATLGRAYWHTGDERYAEIFVAHLESWMKENPPKVGVNWASSLEVSFRAISWLWALHFFKESVHLAPTLLVRALKFLYLHARHLETYLSTYFSPNTHLTGEALGLYYLGTLLPEFKRAARWRSLGRSLLLQELDSQIRADGVYFEQSSYYHRYTADFYTHFYLLSQVNGEAIEARYREKLAGLLDHLMYITRPDGLTPLYGDDDGGRLVMLDERAFPDFRSALATAVVLFSRGDYKFVAKDVSEETFWLTGASGLKAFDELQAEPPANESRAFRESGFFVMRDGWTRSSNYLLVDCGPHGAINGAHSHADALSFELAARGRPLLIDTGTYTYTGSTEMRDAFRSSAAHNTLTIDNESSSVPSGPFHWQHVAESTLRAWHSHARFDYFEGTHNGYERLTNPASHTRSILFLKGGYWIVRDRVESGQAHDYALHFHFATDARPSCRKPEGETAGAVRVDWETESGLEILALGGEWTAREDWVSTAYAQRTLAPCFTFSTRSGGKQEFVTFLIPRAASQSPETLLRERSATGGRLFELRHPEFCDHLMLGDGSRIESEPFVSDFVWSWARFTKDGAQLEELLLIGGQRFHFRGQAIFDSERRAGFVLARRVGNELLVETDQTERTRVRLEDKEAQSRVYSV